ncbi:hypothetical protein [uncultured Psychroserpens sp.]|uniref:hypothetical protein n=1 Tax=uncultured Psychroserpens sp. TaxID=255436 RepID=UPI00260F0BD6|nr:hypothetical protein [uncultured Psychroserpens sp.]
MKNVVIAILLTSLFLVGCTKEGNKKDDSFSMCSNSVSPNQEAYFSDIGEDFTISEIQIEGDCLTGVINFTGSCSTDITLNLIDSEAILESLPLQRNIKLVLDYDNSCDTEITRSFSFNLTPIRVDDENLLELNILGLDNTLYYEY